MYARYIKRSLDFCLSLFAIIVLSPFFVIFTVIGAFAMKGNPLFTQPRPGKNENVFHLIKFRTMTCEKDKNGELLPDASRLTNYGRFLRASSIDELPELFNILKGDMSIVGPRPLRVEYLPYYTEEEQMRHSVRPGLTGLAQVNGRNVISWENRFGYDVEYARRITFTEDVSIIFKTVIKVFEHGDIGERGSTAPEDFDKYRLRMRAEEKQYEHIG